MDSQVISSFGYEETTDGQRFWWRIRLPDTTHTQSCEVSVISESKVLASTRLSQNCSAAFTVCSWRNVDNQTGSYLTIRQALLNAQCSCIRHKFFFKKMYQNIWDKVYWLDHNSPSFAPTNDVLTSEQTGTPIQHRLCCKHKDISRSLLLL